ncbi:MAG: DNA gyrase subunit A, partial [Leptolyngbyaceae cyanobacterium]
LIDQPGLSDEKLHPLVPGPDFPTGGEIIGRKGIDEAYTTGRGSIPVRAVTHTEEVQSGRSKRRRTAIIVTEFPFQVNKASCIEKIATLVNQEKIHGIADIRDESDRDGIRVVIELRPHTLPESVLESLYRQTPLQSNFGAIFLALHGGQPSQLSLRELLQHFLEFRETTLNRQYQHELDQAQDRIHIVEGLLLALESVDEVIEILRQSADGSTSKLSMQDQLGFSDRQSDAILAMRMRRLTGLERQQLQTEYDDLAARVATLETLLTDRKELLKVLKKELRTLKRKFGDPRRTRIISEAERAAEKAHLAEVQAEAAANEENVVLEFTHQGYVRRSSQKSFQRRQAKQEEIGTEDWVEVEDDVVVKTKTAPTSQELLMFTRDGKAYSSSVNNIPVTTRNTKGTPLITLLPLSAQGEMKAEAIATYLLKPTESPLPDLVLLTQQGRIKRIALSEFSKMSSRGITVLKLKEDDTLIQAIPAHEGDQVVVATSAGRLMRFPIDEEQMPLMGRTAQGNLALRLSKNETFVGGAITRASDAEILLVTAQGYAKRMLAMSLKLGTRGSIGSQVMPFHNKTDRLAVITLVPRDQPLIVFSKGDRLIQHQPTAAPLQGRDDRGQRWLKLPPKDTVVKVAIANLPLT